MPDQRRARVARELLLGRRAARPRHPGGVQAGPVLERRRTRAAHERTTGPEIWEQTAGRITHLVASVGTGGTVSGIAHFLKAPNPAIRVIGADPEGIVLSGDTARPYLTEGVGEDFLPGTYDPATVDRWVRVSDRDAFAMARRITREEGILAGRVVRDGDGRRARRGGPPDARRAATAAAAVVVVILPDGGRNYLSKLYNDEWMRQTACSPRPAPSSRVGELLADRHHGPDLPDVILARTTDRVGEAIDTLQRYGISQLPVSERPDGDDLEGIVGSVSENGPAGPRLPRPGDRGADGRRGHGPAAAGARRRREPWTRRSRCCRTARRRCSRSAADGPAGVVSRLDVLEYLAHRRA